MFFKVMIIIHYAAILWYLIGDQAISFGYINWIDNYFTIVKTPFDYYLFSVYYIMATFSTVGYGDIHAVNVIEYIYSIFLMFLGLTGLAR